MDEVDHRLPAEAPSEDVELKKEQIIPSRPVPTTGTGRLSLPKNPRFQATMSGGAFLINLYSLIRKQHRIHGSIFEPDPSCNCGQNSVVCISHGVFLLCIRKDPRDGFFARSCWIPVRNTPYGSSDAGLSGLPKDEFGNIL